MSSLVITFFAWSNDFVTVGVAAAGFGACVATASAGAFLSPECCSCGAAKTVRAPNNKPPAITLQNIDANHAHRITAAPALCVYSAMNTFFFLTSSIFSSNHNLHCAFDSSTSQTLPLPGSS
jgi:hypothetical protein